MSEKDKLREIIRKRIAYHCDERKHDYRLGKACVEPLVSDIIKDMYGAEPVTGIPATENKPLTLEELRGIVEGHVWVESLLDSTVHPALIYSPNAAVYVMGGMQYDSFTNYGKTWLAYRQKPKGGEE